MKKAGNWLIPVLLFYTFLPFLTGCTAVREHVTKAMWKQSGVEDDLTYVQFQQMESADALDDQGFYRSKDIEEYRDLISSRKEGAVHLSFARNDFLKVRYFYNSELDEEIDPLNCRLNPGDELYASAPELTEAAAPFYQFSEIIILELDGDGKIKRQLASQKELPGLIWQIPEDFSGSEIAVLPLGEYRDRHISMNVFYTHPDGHETSLDNGYWLINGKHYGNGSTVLNPTESYRIVYDYSPYMEQWYYASSVPESYWENSGAIAFLTEPTDEDNQSYVVYLHPYGTLSIHNGVTYQNSMDSLLESASAIFTNKSIIETKNIINLLQVNGVPAANNFSDIDMTVSKLKVGDEVMIRIPKDMKLIAEGLQLPSAEEKEEFREYRFMIPDTEEMKFRLTVSYKNTGSDEVFHEIPIEHGVLSLVDSSGIKYSDGSELPAGNEKIKVIIEPDENYCVYGRNVKNNVYEEEMKYDDFVSGFEKILDAHPIKPGIIVTLDTEDELGECVFWTGNDKISGTIVLREGQDLQFDYLLDPDLGYEVILTEADRYQVMNVWNPYAATRVLDVTEALQGKTLRCRDFVTLQEGVKTDGIENPY